MDIVFGLLPFIQGHRDLVFYTLYWLFTGFTVLLFIFLVIRTVQQLRTKEKSSANGNSNRITTILLEITGMRQDIRDLVQEIKRGRNEQNSRTE